MNLRWYMTLVAVSLMTIQSSGQGSQTTPNETATVARVVVSDVTALADACQSNLITAQRDGQRIVLVRMREQRSFRLLADVGLRDGDRIDQLNESAPRSASAIHDAVRALVPGRELTLTVTRDRERLVYRLRVAGSVPPRENAEPAEDNVIVLSEQAIEEEWANQDPWMLLVMAAPRMAMDASGVVIGVTSSTFGNIPLAATLQLRNGDIIQSVNGHAITSEQAIFDTIAALEGESRFTAKLLREGKPVTLRYRVE